jgi:hypothetical protein
VRLFQSGLIGGAFSACIQQKEGGPLRLDLHRLTSSTSRVAVASVLEQMRSGARPIQGVAIITGA